MDHTFNVAQKVTQKVIDFTNMETEGFRELIPIIDNKFKELNVSLRSYINPKTGEICGIPVSQNPDGTIKFRLIQIKGHRYYNLSNTEEAKEWHVIKNSPIVKDGAACIGYPYFRIFDVEGEAKAKIAKISNSRAAIEIIMNLNEVEVLDFGRLNGLDADTNTSLVMRQLLLERAVEFPAAIVALYNNTEERDIRSTIKRAIAVGLIRFDMRTGFMYKGSVAVGTSEDAIMYLLKKDVQLLAAIEMESKQSDKHLQKAIAADEKTQPAKAANAPAKTEKPAEKAKDENNSQVGDGQQTKNEDDDNEGFGDLSAKKTKSELQ